ncbi:MAG: hypothetical protein QNJ58_08780 [Desulfobacterales bacterium]|nr:hypothetical protein [Desulfobacterales bacterium]
MGLTRFQQKGQHYHPAHVIKVFPVHLVAERRHEARRVRSAIM